MFDALFLLLNTKLKTFNRLSMNLYQNLGRSVHTGHTGNVTEGGACHGFSQDTRLLQMAQGLSGIDFSNHFRITLPNK